MIFINGYKLGVQILRITIIDICFAQI
jgi:hypothetical protein